MAAESPRSAPRRAAAAVKDAGGLLSPRFRSAAALAGWDEESLLHAALVVEDTPVRESRRKRRNSSSSSSSAAAGAGAGGGSTGSNTRKRRSRRQPPGSIPPVVLLLVDDEKKPDTAPDGKKEAMGEEKKAAVVGEKEASPKKAAAAAGALPCMDRLREELSCAICLEICFEPSTTPCGHSNSRSCTVNTVLWNTIQLLFPTEIEARRTSMASSTETNDDEISQRSNSIAQGGMGSNSSNGSSLNTQRRSTRRFMTVGGRTGFIGQGSRTATATGGRGFVRASQLVPSTTRVASSDDAALAYRLQQEEFMTAFETEGERQQPPRSSNSNSNSSSSTVSAARENLREMASRAIRLRARGWPI
uniref:RING-type E3 ubiquitin transferase n=1 Tax=Leersia perrieri TaxID=77586 RepID=A0A0D9XYC7_9ORYZ